MGYYTYLTGEFKITPPLRPEHRAYLDAFCTIRHMRRAKLAEIENVSDPIRTAAGLPLGPEGDFFIGPEPTGGYAFSQMEGFGIDTEAGDHNAPASGQPGLWIPWEISPDGTQILAPEEENKHYDFTEWLAYIATTFLRPWGYTIEGECDWRGEDSNDRGTIYAKGTRVVEVPDVIENPGPPWDDDDDKEEEEEK